jgi:hypothetical protein
MVWVDVSARALKERNLAQRALGMALVALLHLLLLLGLLQAVTNPVQLPRDTGREMILRFLPLLKARPLTPTPLPAPAPTRGRAIPVLPPLVAAPSAAQPNLTGLGQSLFGCAPENLANLPPDQRAACAGSLGHAPGDSELAMPKSHVKDPVRRAAEMRTKNTPGRIPCAVLMNAPAPYGGKQIVPSADPFCVLHGLLNGFGPLNGLEK